MMLAHPTLEKPITFDEFNINVLVVEHQKQLCKYVTEMVDQCNGDTGDFVLSDGNILKMDSLVDVVVDPFAIDYNAKRTVSTAMSKVIEYLNTGDRYLETEEFLREYERFIYTVIGEVDSMLVIEKEPTITSLLKCLGLSFDSESDSLLEKICDYLRIVSKYAKIRLFVFVNLKSFLCDEDMEKLYEFVRLEKIHMMLVERGLTYELPGESIVIIDSDLCEVRKSVVFRRKLFDV